MKGMYELFLAEDYDSLKTKVEYGYKSTDLTDYHKSEIVLYDVAIMCKQGTIEYKDIWTTIDAKAKQINLSDFKNIFRIKGIAIRPNWSLNKDNNIYQEQLSTLFKQYKDSLIGWVNDEDVKGTPVSFQKLVVDGLVYFGENKKAFDFSMFVNNTNLITKLSKKVDPTDVITATSNVLFKSDKEISPKDLDVLITNLLDVCYSSKYDQAVKEILVDANNKFYKNIGKSTDWKAACTTIQLGLKRFDK